MGHGPNEDAYKTIRSRGTQESSPPQLVTSLREEGEGLGGRGSDVRGKGVILRGCHHEAGPEEQDEECCISHCYRRLMQSNFKSISSCDCAHELPHVHA